MDNIHSMEIDAIETSLKQNEGAIVHKEENSNALFLDVPLFSIITRPLAHILAPIWKAVCAFRWMASRPLSTPLLPKFFPACLSVPVLKHVPYISIGEVLFLIPIVVILILSINTSIVNKDVEESGSIAALPMIAVFLTANKSNSLITFVLGVPYERMITWHALWSLVAVVTGSLHFYCAYFLGESDDRRLSTTEESNYDRKLDGGSGDGSGDGGESIYGLNGPNPNLVKFSMDGNTNFTGTIALLLMASLVFFSLFSTFRRLAFELWYIPHIAGALIAGIFATIHGAGEIIFVLIWWAMDVTTRYILMASILYPKTASIRKLPGDIVEISFVKPAHFEYEAGQYVMIAIPKLGFSQFHPFTISSSPHHKYVTMHVKALGRWTRRLQKLAEKQDEVTFLMEGPYGKLMVELENHERYKFVLMISGGIGVTPMNSIANSILYEHDCGVRDLKLVRFVWAIRSVDLMRAMNTNINCTGTTVFNSKSKSEVLDLNVYVTKNSNLRDGHPEIDEGLDDISVINHGRPNIDEIFKEMKKSALDAGERNVAVCVCGPSKLVDSCREASRRFSDGVCHAGVNFDFHEETFEF